MRVVPTVLGIAILWPNLAGAESCVPATNARCDDSTTLYEASALAGYGIGGKYEDSTVNRYGVAVGLRAGVATRENVYVGLSFMKFFGGQEQSSSYYTNTLDADLGYSFWLQRGILLIRPQLGLGVAQVVTIQPDNAGYPLALHAAPGLTVGLKLSSALLSLAVREDIVPGQWSNATTVALGVGVAL